MYCTPNDIVELYADSEPARLDLEHLQSLTRDIGSGPDPVCWVSHMSHTFLRYALVF